MIRFNTYLNYFLILIVGILAGYLLFDHHGETQPINPVTPNTTNASNPFATANATGNVQQQLAALQQQVASMNTRLGTLEDNILDTQEQLANIDEEPQSSESQDDKQPISASAIEANMAEYLVKAGLDEESANAIVQKQSELEYKKLDLQDRARRDGNMNSRAFRDEMRALNQQKISLRKEVGDEIYDRFLYETGQNNRMQVSTIMSSSPAERIGLQPGDIITSYGNNKILDWSDIRHATAEGARGEYVTLNIIRNGEPMNLMVERGPLGIRLNGVHYDPQQGTP